MAELNVVRGLPDPARGYNFEVLIPNMPGGGNSEVVSLRVTATSIPGYSSEPSEYSLGGHVLKVPGRGMYTREWAVTLVEGEDMVVAEALEAWHRLQWDRVTGAQAVSQDIKTEIFIRQLNGAKQTAKEWVLEGCWVSNVGDMALDQATSDVLRAEITFSFDNIR